MDLDIIATLLALLLFGFWMGAEIKGPRAVRIVLGCATLGYAIYFTHTVSQIVPRYESKAVSASIKQAVQLMEEGEANRVTEALKAYSLESTKGNSYRAAFEMWHVINHGPRENK